MFPLWKLSKVFTSINYFRNFGIILDVIPNFT